MGQFLRCWGHEVPCWRCFGQGGPRNAIWGMGSCRAFVGGVALIFFALQALDSARLALFLPRAGAFMWVYVAVSAGGFYVFLCGSLYPLEPISRLPGWCVVFGESSSSSVWKLPAVKTRTSTVLIGVCVTAAWTAPIPHNKIKVVASEARDDSDWARTAPAKKNGKMTPPGNPVLVARIICIHFAMPI